MANVKKVNIKSKNFTDEFRDELRKKFPQVFNEDKIDFEKLRLSLGDDLDIGRERYGMNWPGKAQAIRVAQLPSDATLKPDEKASIDFDKTQNLFIEGDNLEVLKLLQKSYFGKIKMCYLDPPYNTGKEFIYPDKYEEGLQTYLQYTGQIDAEGKKFSTNVETDGRFHSNWMNMMWPRLFLARNLLTEDGVIFISIDDHEVVNLRKICDEVFGEENFVGALVWEKKKKGAFLSGNVTNIKEYIIVYSKNNTLFRGLIGETARQEETYPVIKTTNTRGVRKIKKGIHSKYSLENHVVSKGARISAGNMEMILLDDMVIENSQLKFDVKVDSNWIYSQKLLDEYADNNELYITQDLYFRRIVKDPREKKLKDILFRVGENEISGTKFVMSEDLALDGWGTNEDGNLELHQLLGVQNIFDFPKPSKLLSKLFFSLNDDNVIILDFFAGSGTTAHSVMNLNAQDGGNRKFILVQLPERTDDESEAYKAGYKNITEIAEERIKSAGKKIFEENKEKDGFDTENFDKGFKVFKLDKSNFSVWDGAADGNIQKKLELHVDNTDPNSKEEDILYEILIKAGFELAEKVEETKIDDKKVYSVSAGQLLICLDKNLDKDFVRSLAEKKPKQFICLNSSFKEDADLTNTAKILENDQIEFRTI